MFFAFHALEPHRLLPGSPKLAVTTFQTHTHSSRAGEYTCAKHLQLRCLSCLPATQHDQSLPVIPLDSDTTSNLIHNNGLSLAIWPRRHLFGSFLRKDAVQPEHKDQPLFLTDRVLPFKTTPAQDPLDSLLGLCVHPHRRHPHTGHRRLQMGSGRVHRCSRRSRSHRRRPLVAERLVRLPR